MEAAVIKQPGKVKVSNVPDAVPGEQDVVIRVYSSGICGTDVHIYQGDYLGSYPIIPGHEFAGVVEAVGSAVSRVAVGDRVAIEPNIACDNCESCLNNRQNFCKNWNGVGVTLPGGMAELACVPEKAVFDIGSMPFSVAAFVEPLACVLHGVERARFRLGDRVLIIGAGPIGLLLSKTIMLQGACEITQLDRNGLRLELARSAGVAHTASSLEGLPAEAYDVVVDATGVPTLMEQTIQFVRPGGTILLFGVPPQSASITLPAFPIFKKGLTILSSFTSVRNSIQAVRLLESGAIDVSALLTHSMPLDDLETGLKLMESGGGEAMKIHILPNG